MPALAVEIHRVATGALEIAYEAHGPPDGDPAILLHGFPYDPRSFDAAAAALAGRGLRVLVPYLRGFGPTRLRAPAAMRSGQQAAVARDLADFMDALAIPRAALVGYDWGGRAACIAAALWPERVRCLVTGAGYAIQDIAAAVAPQAPETEHRLWYQYYFHTERGRAGLEQNRRALCRYIWQIWSPDWEFDDATYENSAVSFDNPDFVAVTIQSYRHRFGYAAGDPALEPIEQRLAAQPTIAVPTIVLHGASSGIQPPEGSEAHARLFAGPYQRHVLPKIGHNLPQEAPRVVADAILELAHAH